MTTLERDLLAALVDAQFWLHVGQPECVPVHLIYCLSHQLHERAAAGQARTILRPSKLNQ